jgi:thiosulfate/3-mercaptopyruvate sulfurtransferase
MEMNGGAARISIVLGMNDSHRSRYLFVDCRWDLADPDAGRRLYREGHIPGAVFLDVEQDLSDLSREGMGRHPLPSAERFAATASASGIDAETFVVAYGSLGGAERLWWLLRHFGHDACAVLRGGIESWGGPLRAGDEVAEPARFVPRERTDDTIDADVLAARLGDAELTLVDARTPNRWRGEPNPVDARPGRIPGALNAPWMEPLPALPEGQLIVYCGSGVTGCVVLHRASLDGRDGVLYPGSWSDWSARELPLERS